MTARKVLSEIFIYLIALLWLYASVYKFLQVENSINQLVDSPLIAPYAVLLGYALPVIEFVLFVLLLLPGTRRIALFGSAVLLTIFIVYIIIILNFYKADTPCICGGIISKLSWKNHVYFNLAFLMMSIYSVIEPNIGSFNRAQKRITLTQT
ncbi:hypothetical protein FAZ19_15765 [Sphingobacterium alkalisoli]|uniref:Methylamine utilisation protein MauE domain-containing protein n=1 Tax=Sphingobacterium alkalisoli TaxID=1874115 RepID=A0A4U0GXH0_9SPHI|nr:MauE/DoxX family redox-associated membrane protein [Sphingobacterium alkalisoli]TJY63726.1 hypothetical protein FAZ19_15765 [Sphingobacterium alkalisoli]GGH25273.1 hypothetical protein GCM10011418_33780 [Sphingobacterium alkalisoli]